LELLVYLALAGLSFAFALHAVSGATAGTASDIHSFEIAQFVDYVNTALLGGGSFSAELYLPVGLCNSTISGSSLVTGYGRFYFVGRVAAQKGVLCPDGTYALLGFHMENGTENLVRG
jgi:hypothetical protein